MSPTAWKRLKEVFEAALEHQGADRGAYLASVCEGDQSLRAEVERLLAGADQAGSFLEQSPAAPEPEDASDREDFQIGQAVSHYQITAKLGHGGMGTVYQAMDLQLRRPVALKVTRGRWLREVDPNRRFLQEARAASALNHPNICHIYEIGETEGVRFIAMEYVEGRTLEAVIAQGPLELSQVALLGAQMADALAEAHAHGIIHRDIKPANLMIGPRGELKVLDFGLAKAVAGSGAAGLDTNEGTLTRTGLVMGTVRYMSPEQLLGQHLDHRSDIFSLGLVLYEIATGGPAFTGETQVETIDRILHDRPESVEAWPALDRIVSKCLAKDRARRYQSATDIAGELRNLGQQPVRPGRFRLSRPLAVATAIVLLLVVMVFAGIRTFEASRAAGSKVRIQKSEATAQRWDHLTFEKIAAVGDPAPGGGNYTRLLIPCCLNTHGDIVFSADVGPARQALFLWRSDAGSALQLARNGEPAPGGGIFDKDIAGSTINDSGDVAFGFELKSSELRGVAKEGLFRYSHADQKASAVIIPGVTPAPGFGVFLTTWMRPHLNNSGDMVFPAAVRAPAGASLTPGIGMGIFLLDRNGQFSKIVVPGDPAPGGGKFDFAQNPWINDRGDVAFGGHVAGEECYYTTPFACAESVYFKSAATGVLESIAHQGDVAPSSARYQFAWGPLLNNRGDLVFIPAFGPLPGRHGTNAIYLRSGGNTIPVAGAGDFMPEGRKIVTANPSTSNDNYGINNRRDISFNALLENGESAVYVYSQGIWHLVAGTGTVIPGVGTIASAASSESTGAVLNDKGQVAFGATLTDGGGVLLLATPAARAQAAAR